MRQGKVASSQDGFSRARRLFFSALYEECIEACAEMQMPSAEERSELTLLSGRSLLRLGRFGEVESVLAQPQPSLDASLTSTMLVSMARLLRGSPDEALEILQAITTQVGAAHQSVSSEFELCLAAVDFAKRDIHSSLDHLLKIRVDSDVIHAQALVTQGFCYHWLGKQRDAATSFVAALIRLDECEQPDAFVAASAMSGLSTAALHLTDVSLMRVVQDRMSKMDWSRNMIRARSVAEANIVSLAIFTGDLERAASLALHSIAAASSVTSRAGKYSQLATIARHAGDRFIPHCYMEAAWRGLSEHLDVDIQSGEPTGEVLLNVIQESAAYDAARSRKLSSVYKRSQTYRMDESGSPDLLRARERYIEGSILKAESSNSKAQECFREAHEIFRRCDSTLYAIESAYALALLGDEAMYWYSFGALAGVQNWMTEGLARRPSTMPSTMKDGLRAERQSILTNLTPSQREVVGMVCAGKSNPEIAALRRTSVQTVKNLLTAHIFPAFGVTNRIELKDALSGLSVPSGGDHPSANRRSDAIPVIKETSRVIAR
jgi:DNA-binding NarL/FixJ family response regulator